MKNIIGSICFILFFTGSLYPHIAVVIKPGIELFEDGFAFGGGLDLKYHFSNSGIVTGDGLYLSGALNLSGSERPLFSAAETRILFGAGYSVPLGKTGFSLAPEIRLGGGIRIQAGINSLAIVSGFIVQPAFCAEYTLNKDTSVGLESFIQLFLDNKKLQAGIGFSTTLAYLLPENTELTPEMRSEKQQFTDELNIAILESKLNAEVSNISASEIRLNLPEILFENNSANLNQDSINLLALLSGKLLLYSDIYMLVNGYTDIVGDDQFNILLSEKRAKNVAGHLAASGIPRERMVYRGWGKAEPIASNDTAEGRSKNRRVEVRFIWVKRK